MRTRLKICCIASFYEARIAIAAGTDALGLVAAMPSDAGKLAAFVEAVRETDRRPLAGDSAGNSSPPPKN